MSELGRLLIHAISAALLLPRLRSGSTLGFTNRLSGVAAAPDITAAAAAAACRRRTRHLAAPMSAADVYSPAVRDGAYIKDKAQYDAMYQRSVEDPNGKQGVLGRQLVAPERVARSRAPPCPAMPPPRRLLARPGLGELSLGDASRQRARILQL